MEKWKKISKLSVGLVCALYACLAASTIATAALIGRVPIGLYRIFEFVWIFFGQSVFFWQILGMIMLSFTVLGLSALVVIMQQVYYRSR